MPIPKHTLSKTSFLYGCQCPKRLWLHKKKPSLRDELSVQQQHIFQQGTDVGKLAQSLFPGGVDASPPNAWSYAISVADTAKYIRNGHQIIYEAAFQYNGILCAVDILIKTAQGWVAYEVKGSLSLKPTHVLDAALQYHVLSNSELAMSDFVIVHINKNYIRQGELDLKKLFYPVSVLRNIVPMQTKIAARSDLFQEILQREVVPDISVGDQCTHPYPCDFFGHCHAGIFQQTELNVQVPSAKITAPASILQLETWMNAVPLKDGDWPYKKNIFAYSILKASMNDQPKIEQGILENKLSAANDFYRIMIEALQGEATIFVEEEKQMFYLLKDLKTAIPDLVEKIDSVQKRLAGINFPPMELGDATVNTHHDASAAFFNLEDDDENTRRLILDFAKRRLSMLL